MVVLLAASMVVVMLLGLAQVVVPALHDPHHRRDLEMWHVVMGGAMAAMLVVALARGIAAFLVAVFLVGLCWSARRVATPGARAAYLRLGVGCAAMAAMLLPTATASAATSAQAPPAGHSLHSTTHSTMHMTMAPPGSTAVVVPAVVVALLVAACGVIVLARLAGTVGAGRPLARRMSASCDVAMAGAMGYMLVAML